VHAGANPDGDYCHEFVANSAARPMEVVLF
jgi:hypothetical protein